jgi:iron-sulfur cluster assembly protein
MQRASTSLSTNGRSDDGDNHPHPPRRPHADAFGRGAHRQPDGAVKLSTPRRGCSGLAYSVDYVTGADSFDEKIVTPGGDFYVDGGSILYLVGSTMDWVEDDFTAGFVFANPNAKGSCGCGESFTV